MLSATNGPAVGAYTITPSNTTILDPVPRQLKITGAGNITVVWLAGMQTTHAVSAGEVLNWRVTKVMATGTTATGIWAFG